MQPTAGLVEIEPSMAWNPSVVSGIGVVQSVDELYNDMHSYLASAGMQLSPYNVTPAVLVTTDCVCYQAMARCNVWAWEQKASCEA